MIETGTVISIDKDLATVKIHRGKKCAGCRLCDSFGSDEMRLVALNMEGVGIGDTVEVKVEPDKVVKHSILLFIIPILAMVFGYWISMTLSADSNGEGAGILGAFAALLIVLLGIKRYNDRYSQKEKSAAKIIGLKRDQS